MRKLVLLVVMVFSSSLFAHNSLLDSSPESGAVIDFSPDALEFTFSDATYFVELEVKFNEGAIVPVKFVPSMQASSHFSFVLPDLRNGEYAVKWMVEGDDTHQVKGEFSFMVEGFTE